LQDPLPKGLNVENLSRIKSHEAIVSRARRARSTAFVPTKEERIRIAGLEIP
jgi:hypothetical protein